MSDSREVNFMENKTNQTKKMVLSALLTAVVIIFQLIGGIPVGPCNLAISLIPIVIGAVICSPLVGAWLGFVCGATILISGQATLFVGFSLVGAIVTTLVKGVLCGYLSGLVYKVLKNKNRTIAAVTAAITCPVVNTGVFFIGCLIFFVNGLAEMAGTSGIDSKFIYFMFTGLAGVNFLLEFFTNLILSPIIVKLISFKEK